jgi:hypothetical protein
MRSSEGRLLEDIGWDIFVPRDQFKSGCLRSGATWGLYIRALTVESSVTALFLITFVKLESNSLFRK